MDDPLKPISTPTPAPPKPPLDPISTPQPNTADGQNPLDPQSPPSPVSEPVQAVTSTEPSFQEPAPQKNPRSKIYGILFLGLVFLLIALAGGGYAVAYKKVDKLDNSIPFH